MLAAVDVEALGVGLEFAEQFLHLLLVDAVL